MIQRPSSQYERLVERLFATSFFGGMKLGLKNAFDLSEALGAPENSFKSVLVAGTNGKGSVTLKIAKTLQLNGYRVGHYTSPHLSTFRERIKVNGEMISEEAVVRLLSHLFSTVEEKNIPATFFELMTILALSYFKEQKVDFAVLEVGLGGRLDTTNIVTPILSVITSISFDHMNYLGDDLESIAKEKGGIIKSFVPVILGPTSAEQAILLEMAKEKEAPCIVARHSKKDFYDIENQAIARAALGELSKRYEIKQEAIEAGLLHRPPCRFQILNGMNSPPWVGGYPEAIILDVAHNPSGLQRLFEAVHEQFPGRLIRVVAGLSKDKDMKECLKIIVHESIHLHCIKAPHVRAASLAELQKLLVSLNYNAYTLHTSIDEAVKSSISHAAEMKEVLVICGTFFIMSEVRHILGIIEPRDALQLNENTNRPLA